MDGGLSKVSSAAAGNACPQVAVLLATYNGMPYLEEQIASIFAQINVDITLFVSDDGSTDGSLAFLCGIKAKKIYILPSKIAGSGANNFYRLICDAEIDQFDYVALSDQDDIWSPRKLDRAITQIIKYKCGGYSSDLIAFNQNDGKVWYLSKSDEPSRFDYLFQGASAGCTYVLTRDASILVRKKISPALNTFPKNNSHDWLIYAICRSHGLGWHVDKQAHIFYRQHGQNSYGALPGYSGLVTRFRLAGSGWYRQHVLWLFKFLINMEDEIAVFLAVERLGWKERIWLALHAKEYRRRKRDRYLLVLIIIMGVF